MTHDPTQLAIKIGKYIQASRGCSYTDIKDRAALRDIDQHTLEEALRILHRQKTIHRTVAGGDVQYVFRVPVAKPVTAISHVAWLRDNYPPMTSENDGSGIDLDLSWMFLKTLEERQAYKEAVAGRYVKTRPYEFA